LFISLSAIMRHVDPCRHELLGAAMPNPRWQAPPGAGARGAGGRAGGEEGSRGVVVIERPRRAELQRAAEVAVDRMAAKRNFPQVGRPSSGPAGAAPDRPATVFQLGGVKPDVRPCRLGGVASSICTTCHLLPCSMFN
jgi:hypothetical protein